VFALHKKIETQYTNFVGNTTRMLRRVGNKRYNDLVAKTQTAIRIRLALAVQFLVNQNEGVIPALGETD
jgi:hypothetical protein